MFTSSSCCWNASNRFLAASKAFEGIWIVVCFDTTDEERPAEDTSPWEWDITWRVRGYFNPVVGTLDRIGTHDISLGIFTKAWRQVENSESGRKKTFGWHPSGVKCTLSVSLQHAPYCARMNHRSSCDVTTFEPVAICMIGNLIRCQVKHRFGLN